MASTSVEGGRLVFTHTYGSSGSRTNAVYLRMYNKRVKQRAQVRSSLWHRKGDGVEVLQELSVFRACRCLQEPEPTYFRGHLSAIDCFHRMHAEWELPTTYFQILEVFKTIDGPYASTQTKPIVRNLLMWDNVEGGIGETCLERASIIVPVALLRSEIWAYESGLVPSDFCLTRRDKWCFLSAQCI